MKKRLKNPGVDRVPSRGDALFRSRRRFRQRVLARACGVALPMLILNRHAISANVFVDLNTYSETKMAALNVNAVSATTAFAGADGVWLIEGNSGGIASNSSSGFTLANWQTMIGNIAGPHALVSTEDNPPSGTNYQNQSYVSTDQIVGVTGMGMGTSGFTYLDAMSYNETGSQTGGTLLSSTQIAGEANTHGGTIAVLTRGYITSGWTTPTNNDLANSSVTAAVMETDTLSENVTGFVQACYLTGKRTYVYMDCQDEDSQVISWTFDLKQQDPVAMASANTSVILYNGYNQTNSANDYSWYGGDGTVQDSTAAAIEMKTIVPVNTFIWNANTSGNVSTASNWTPVNILPGHNTVAASTGTSPMNPYDAFSFTNAAVNGNITATLDVTTAQGLGVYFSSNSANYTLASGNSSDVLNLTGYGTVGTTGDVGYGVNVVPIVVQGTGSDTISAAIVMSTTNTAGLTIDQQNTTNPFLLSGSITTNGTPITVQGAGNTTLTGHIIGNTVLTKTGTGTLLLGGASANSGVIATVTGGTLSLNASGAGPAVEAITDIAGGATVNVTGTATTELSSTYSGANLTINSGGTFDLSGQNVQLTAIAGISGQVTDTSTTPVTLTIGATNQSGAFAGSINSSIGVLSLVKFGAGTQTLSGPNNFTGTTTLTGGTLALRASGTLGTGNLIFNGTSTVNLGGTTQTFSNVSAGTSTSAFTATLTDGSLTITGTSGFHFVPINTTGTTTLDASGLTRLTFNQPTQNFEVSSQYVSTPQGAITMMLPAGAGSTASITAATVYVGDTYHSSSPPLSTLVLGQSTTMNLGAGGLSIAGYNANGTVNFASGLTNPTLKIRGLTGGVTADPLITLGNNNTGGDSSTAMFNVSNGTIDSIVNTFNLANLGSNNDQTTIGTFIMGPGTLNAGTIAFGSGTAAASGAKVNSTFTQNAGTVLAGTLNFSNPVNTSAGVYTGVYNLGNNTAASSAATLLATTVLITYPNAATSSQAINFSNGTIANYDDTGIPGGTGVITNLTIGGHAGGGAAGNASTLTINLLSSAGTSSHDFAAQAGHSITVASTALITGAGALTATGAGTVNLNGTDTYTGGTYADNGTLYLGTAAAFPASTNLSIGSTAITSGPFPEVVLANHNGSTASIITVSHLILTGSTNAWTGKLDLTNNAMDISAGSNVLATVTNQTRQGFDGGTWNGAGGIVSSTAAGSGQHLTALGVIQNNQSGIALFTASHQFEGITPGVADILTKFTYYGDANLSGNVDGSDYSLIDNGYLEHLTGWYNGDFNYDGVVNGSDYTLIDNAFNSQGAQLTASIAGPDASIAALIADPSSVPEPAAMSLLLVTGTAMLSRRVRVALDHKG
jgi:autotransporter-associated beta strand protein